MVQGLRGSSESSHVELQSVAARARVSRRRSTLPRHGTRLTEFFKGNLELMVVICSTFHGRTVGMLRCPQDSSLRVIFASFRGRDEDTVTSAETKALEAEVDRQLNAAFADMDAYDMAVASEAHTGASVSVAALASRRYSVAVGFCTASEL